MFKEGIIDKILSLVRKLVPRSIFKAFQPYYHWFLAWVGAVLYGFPSRKMKVIGVTGTKGKSTTTFIVAKIFEEAGIPVASIGSLGYKIKDKEWPNTLKMTMPGRMKLQKFLSQAKKQGVEKVVLEVTSEGIAQKRHLGIDFDCAVLTNIHKEHIENHGSFENYIAAKKQLFKKTKNIHVLNNDDPLSLEFEAIPSNKKILFSFKDWEQLNLTTKLVGDFNKLNILAATAVAQQYGIEHEIIKRAINKIDSISGRMEYIDMGQNFKVVVDYAHTPDSLEAVYKTLRKNLPNSENRLIAVLGAAGGGRDRWKRPEFGKIAEKNYDLVILTDEDPFEEDPREIIYDIQGGMLADNHEIIIDREKAIKKALTEADENDTVIITGKGSETSMALSGGRKIPWSDKEIVEEILKNNNN